MNGAPARGWFLAWPAAVIVLGLALHVFNPWGAVSALQAQSLTVFERLWPRDKVAPKRPNAPAVRYVDIDAESLKREGPWPWPRADLARLVSTLLQSGARVVVLDLPLAGPDPTAPARALRGLPGTPEAWALQTALSALPDSDAALAHALGEGRVVTRFSLAAKGGEPAPERAKALVAPTKSITRALPKWPGAVLPFSPLMDKSAGLGAALPAEPGATALGVPLVYNVAGTVQPSLELEAIRMAERAPPLTLTAAVPRTRYEALLGRPGLAQIHVGGLAIPVSRRGVFWYHAATAAAVPPLMASSVLSKGVRPELRDAIVVVGASGADGAITLTSPLGPSLPSTALLADRIRQILAHSFVERPIWAEAGEELFMLVSGIALLLLLSHAPLAWPIATALLAIFGAGYVSGIAFAREQWFLDPLMPSLTLALALCAGIAARKRRSAIEAAERREASEAYGPALQPARTSSRSGSSGEERIVTVIACDMRNFADLLARYAVSANALARLLRAFEGAMGEIVVKNKGQLALVRGGRLLAAFNVVPPDSEHAANACNCALRMIDALERLNATLADEARAEAIAFEPVTITMGIATGPAVASRPEPGTRPELLPVGATVALAETLQRHADDYGSAIIVDEETRAQAQKLFALLEIDLVHVDVRQEPMHVFALLGNPLVKASPKFRALQATHDEIFTAYRGQNWQLARALIRECRKLPAAVSALYDLYEARIADLEREAPDPAWNGAHALIVEA
jgi:adenylate cyclase